MSRFHERSLARAYVACWCIAAVFSNSHRVGAETSEERRLLQQLEKLHAASNVVPGAQCGPASTGSGSIVGHFAQAKKERTHILVRFFESGPSVDAYLRMIGRTSQPAQIPKGSPEQSTAMLATQQSDITAVSTLYRTVRAALVEPDGSFSCRGMAAGRYTLVIQLVNLAGATIDGVRAPTSEFYTAEAALPKERPNYRYIATASAFRPL